MLSSEDVQRTSSCGKNLQPTSPEQKTLKEYKKEDMVTNDSDELGSTKPKVAIVPNKESCLSRQDRKTIVHPNNQI